MDKELEKYYEAQFVMFGEQGWRDFVQQVNEMLAATNSIAGIEDAKALHYRQGECSIMQWVISSRNRAGVTLCSKSMKCWRQLIASPVLRTPKPCITGRVSVPSCNG